MHTREFIIDNISGRVKYYYDEPDPYGYNDGVFVVDACAKVAGKEKEYQFTTPGYYYEDLIIDEAIKIATTGYA